MKIVKFKAENIKKIEVVEIEPSGNLVPITGRNGQGKSSILDAIAWALCGQKEHQSVPIRKGQDSGYIEIDLGEYIVTRTFREGKASQVTVESKEGAKFGSPQAMLDKLFGTIAFDPLAFARMKPKEQFDTLRSLVKIDFDFAGAERENADDFGHRTAVNKGLKELRASIATAAKLPADLPEGRIDTAALLDEIQAAAQHNADIDRARERRDYIKTNIDSLREKARANHTKAAQLRKQADAEEAEAKSREQVADSLETEQAQAPPLPERIDPAAVRAKLTRAEQINRQITDRNLLRNMEAKAAGLEAEAKKLTERMEGRTAAKLAAISRAQMPIEGIGFGEGLVLLGGVPFDQASSAEQLRASCAIAMAGNPKLRVIRIKDGSLLDEDSLNMLAQMAETHDYQVWIERVDTSGKLGIVIEEGRVLRHEAKEVSA